MRKNRKWTKEEEQFLVQAIKANPLNISKACRETGNKISRTPQACYMHWYYVLSQKNTNTALFILVGKSKVYKNRKNTNKTITPTKHTLWLRIKQLLKLK